MKRKPIPFILLLLIALAALGAVFQYDASAASTLVKGPYLMYEGANTAMTVHWQTDVNESNLLRWGTDTTYSSGSANVGTYGSANQHKYTITGLQPDTKYYYEVNGSATGSFRTAPADSATSVKFLAYGDSRSYPANQELVAEEMRAKYAADPAYQTLLLHDGDFIGSDTESDWTSQYFVSGASYPQMHALQSEMPVVGARGNHEGSGTVYKKYFPYPYVANYYWSFNYGPIHFVVLDGYASFTEGSAQYNWLVNDLASSTKPWKIVMVHQPGWGAGTHSNDTNIQSDIHPVLQQYGVQLYVNGHNHNYARAVVDGIQYVTTGGGGASLYDVNTGWPNIVAADKSFHHIEYDVQGSNMTMTARRTNGTVIETVNVAQGGGGNQSPVANAGTDQTVTDSDGNGSENVTLNGSASTDPDGTITSYVWKEGATQIATGATPSVSLGVGTHTITLTVTDNDGATDDDTVVVTVNAQGGGNPVTISTRVNAGSDDAEERQTGGNVNLTSSDLELVYDSGTTGNQFVGMRFNSVNIPVGKTITNAYIQFTVDETNSGATSLTVKGQAADSPGTFTTAAYNVSSRAATAAAVAWSPVAWNTVGAAGVDQRTPDLKTIVQEIVNRPGWAQNNSMVFFVTGTGERTAEAYNGVAASAPLLVVTYQ